MSRSSEQTKRGLGSDASEPRFLVLGQVRRPHGVRGDLFLKLATDYPERIADLEAVYLATDIDGTDALAYTVSSARPHRDGLILRLESIHDRDQADRLRRQWVLVQMRDAVPLEEGEFYLFQLMGLEVITGGGETLGTVQDIIETGANDVYVIEGPRGEVLIPAVPHVVRSIDLTAQRITVELPDGLLA